jgi:hypothetical protein
MFDSQPIQGLIMPVGMKMRFTSHTLGHVWIVITVVRASGKVSTVVDFEFF